VLVFITELLQLWVAFLLDVLLNGPGGQRLLLFFKIFLVLIELLKLIHDRLAAVESQAVGAGVADLDDGVVADASTRHLHLLHRLSCRQSQDLAARKWRW